jgi:hypothetical protein
MTLRVALLFCMLAWRPEPAKVYVIRLDRPAVSSLQGGLRVEGGKLLLKRPHCEISVAAWVYQKTPTRWPAVATICLEAQ